MIVCKLELWPGGIEKNVTHLGTIEIGNNVVGTVESGGRLGTYNARIFKKRKSEPWGDITIEDFPRKSYHPWNLIREILNRAATLNGGRL